MKTLKLQKHLAPSKTMTLDQKIEALLFFKAEPLSIKEIAKILEEMESAVKDALDVLSAKLEDRGLRIIWKEDKILLGTHKEMGPLLEKLRKEELNKELTKAAQETLSIILYKNGATRSEIDWIRGVNSSFILRSLLVRGLVERRTHPRDSRKYLYQSTFELLQHLGVSKIEELPEYEEVSEKLTDGIKDTNDTDKEEENEQAPST